MRFLVYAILLISLVVIYDQVQGVGENMQGAVDFKDLIQYHGKDLRKLENNQRKQLLEVLTKIFPHRDYNCDFGFQPWYVWEFRAINDKPFYLLFEVDNTKPLPSSTSVRITEMDAVGTKIEETTFDTGHRCYLRKVHLETTQTNGEYPIISLDTDLDSGLGSGIGKQLYGKVGSFFHLIRLEDRNGNATRNSYHIKHFQSGTVLPNQTEAEWISDLGSKDRERTLRALVWLGGIHYDLKEGDEVRDQNETRENISLVRSVRGNKKVGEYLGILMKNDDLWIREAAKLAFNTKDTRY